MNLISCNLIYPIKLVLDLLFFGLFTADCDPVFKYTRLDSGNEFWDFYGRIEERSEKQL